MPYTKDGRRVDLMLPLPSIVNRTIGEPLFELFITGAAYQVRQKMKELPSLAKQAEMLFDFVYVFDKDWCATCKADYESRDLKGKKQYIQDAIEDGIYINQVNIAEDEPIFYKCIKALEEFPFLTETDTYVKRWGREIKVLNPCWLGDMYILKLKQTSRKGFSARSTGAIDSRGLPIRSYKTKAHLEEKSTSCIRFGEFENLTLSIGMPTEDLALFNALYRVSAEGGKDLINWMFHDDADPNAVLELKDSYNSIVGTIFNVVLKTLGVRISYVDDADKIHTLNDTIVTEHELDGYIYFCTDYQFYLIETMYELRERILERYPITTTKQLNKLMLTILQSKQIVDGPIEKELENLMLKGTDEKIRKKVEEVFGQSEDENEQEQPLVDQVPIVLEKKRKSRKKKTPEDKPSE